MEKNSSDNLRALTEQAEHGKNLINQLSVSGAANFIYFRQYF